MFHCEIKVRSRSDKQTESLTQALWQYAAELYRQGCIAHNHWIESAGRTVWLHCVIPEKIALHSRFQDTRGRAELQRLRKQAAQPPIIRVLGELSESPAACTCRRHKAFHLFTTFIDESSPLACDGCGKPVPLYRLPELDRSLKENLLNWQQDYKSCDRLYISSGFAEMWAYRQKSRLDSGLTREGRDLCAEVESKVKTPVYYYLDRYRGRSSKAEEERRCPGCGETWLLPVPQGCFEFKCSRCRLLSRQACDLFLSGSRPAKPPPSTSSKVR